MIKNTASPNLFRYKYDMKVNVDLSLMVAEEASKEGRCQELMGILPAFMNMTMVEVKAGALS